MAKLIEMVGQRFGRLVVVGRAENSKAGHIRWKCQCDCGSTTTVGGTELRSGHTSSCRCLSIEIMRARCFKHGQHHENREYRTWCAMKQRCANPNHADYADYGGRGIRVCDEWQSSFIAFLRDVGRCPSDRHSIDRFPNNDGNYEPGNTRWATPIQQGRNQRTNRLIAIGGRTQCTAGWAEEYEISPAIIWTRLHDNWNPVAAVILPKGHKKVRTEDIPLLPF